MIAPRIARKTGESTFRNDARGDTSVPRKDARTDVSMCRTDVRTNVTTSRIDARTEKSVFKTGAKIDVSMPKKNAGTELSMYSKDVRTEGRTCRQHGDPTEWVVGKGVSTGDRYNVMAAGADNACREIPALSLPWWVKSSTLRYYLPSGWG